MTSLVFLLTSFLFGCSLGSSEFPNPQKEWRMCGRTKASYICDPDFILDRGEAERLDQIAHDFRRSTSCVCPKCSENDPGVSIGVFIRKTISNESLSQYSTGNDISEMLRRRWGLSASSCNGDIIVILVTQLNMTGYSLGSAVAPLIPTLTADRIMAECRGHFESGYHYQGLESVLNSLGDALVEGQRLQIGPSFLRNMALGIGLGFGVLLLLALVALALLHRQQVITRDSNCEDIFQETPKTNNNRRHPSFDNQEHLEKLRQLQEEEDGDDEDGLPQELRPPYRYLRAYRQLSDVAEESEDDISKRNSSLSSSCCSPKGSVPVTEL